MIQNRVARGLGVVAAVAFVCALGWSVQATAEGCRDACARQRAEAENVCSKVDTAQQERCRRNADEAMRTCSRRCPSGRDEIEACKQVCNEVAAEEMKKCEKMKPGPGRAKCRQVVEERRGNCYGDCERRYK